MRHLFIVLCLLLVAGESLASRLIEGNQTWSGKVTISEGVIVRPGATLTLKPGTELRFAANTALAVEGRLVARGTKANPIVFRPETGSKAGSWQGLSFQQGAPEGSDLEQVRIEGAVESLAIGGSKVRLAQSTLANGSKGISLGGGSTVKIEGVTIRQMSEGGIDANVGSQGQIVGCRIEQVSGFGIQTGKKTQMLIRDNHISQVKYGILVNGEFPPIQGNILDHCEVAIVVLQAPPSTLISGNQVSESKTGIACQQFASPTIEGNTLENCDKGIECFQSSSPLIRRNRFKHNSNGLFCVQMCNPQVIRNDFVDNQTAIYLHLSSYAVMHENNFEQNRLHIELDNMSYDWELRATKKPTRSRQAQNATLAQQGRALAEDIAVKVDSEGFVNAKGNYWGKETTAEIKRKGSEANLSAIKDGFDVPIRTYEGWPGEYKQDRVRFDNWQAQRIAGTGPEALAAR